METTILNRIAEASTGLGTIEPFDGRTIRVCRRDESMRPKAVPSCLAEGSRDGRLGSSMLG